MTVYMISGHIDLTDVEFHEHYKPKIDEALKDEDSTFVTGSAPGADYKSLHYLWECGVSRYRVTVYFKGTYDNPFNFQTRGPFKNHTKRDEALTANSDKDIAYIRPAESQKKMIEAQGKVYDPKFISGTMKNLERRFRKDF